jgi:hypothetical protein
MLQAKNSRPGLSQWAGEVFTVIMG